MEFSSGMCGDSTTQHQLNGSDNNNVSAASQQPAIQLSKQTATNTDKPHQKISSTCGDEIEALLDTVLTRIVGELSLTQAAPSQPPIKLSAEDASKQRQLATSSPSLSPDDATCDLVIDSASNSADNQDSETQEAASSNFGALLSTPQTLPTTCSKHSPPTQQPLLQPTNLMPLHSQPHDDEDEEDKIKDIVTLRNLEVTPPPPIPATPVATETTKKQTTHDEQPAQAVTTDKSIQKTHTAAEQEASKESKSSTTGACKRARPSEISHIGSGEMLDESLESTSSNRSKRQRTQTKLFQVGSDVSPTYCDSPAPSVASSSKSKSSSSAAKTTRQRKKSTATPTSTTNNTTSATTKSTPPPPPPHAQSPPIPKQFAQHTNDLQGVIFYEKNDYLAIRNEENSFYLCQLTENVRVSRPMVRVRWLDTKDNKNYFLTSLFDHVPQLSILMPVNLTKLKQERKSEQMFALSNQDRDNILDRLKRSLNASAINQSSSNTTS